MIWRGRSAVLFSLLSVALVAAGCGSSAPAAKKSVGSGKPIVAKFALFTGATSPQTLAAQRLGKLLSKATNGRIVIQTYPLGELGSTQTVLSGLETNSVQMTVTGGVSSLVPQFDAMYLPYLFPTEQAVMKVSNGPVGQQIWSHFSHYHMKVIGVWPFGYSDFLTDKQVTSVASLKGLKLRVFDPPVGDLTDRALGANPTPIDVNQVFTALQTHTVDGMDDPISSLVSGKDYQAVHYLAITKHFFVFGPVLVSQAFWSELTPSDQKALIKAEREVEPYEWQLAQQQEKSGIKTMQQAGVIVTHPSLQAFQAATKVVYQQVDSIVGKSLVQEIQKAAQSGN